MKLREAVKEVVEAVVKVWVVPALLIKAVQEAHVVVSTSAVAVNWLQGDVTWYVEMPVSATYEFSRNRVKLAMNATDEPMRMRTRRTMRKKREK